MLKALKTKFMVLAMSALFFLLAVIIAGMNAINYNSVVKESEEVLSVLSQSKGMFPDMPPDMIDIPGPIPGSIPPRLSPETPYEARYFWVTINEAGDIMDFNTSHITSIDKRTAIDYAEKVLTQNLKQGFIDDYRCLVYQELNGTCILFLDCGRRLHTFRRFLYTSVAMALAGFVIVFLIIFILSGKILKPIIQSYEKQRQFITDAGHEMKTPLTIISANADILEMELGEHNESLQDIQKQTKRLRTLTEDLVMLARMEESETKMPKIDFPLSDVIEEAAHPFSVLAGTQGKKWICHIQPMLSFYGNSPAISQLISILLENALKYSPAGGIISLTLAKKGRTISLSVFNTTDTAVDPEQLKFVFDRFYRMDRSRNSETGGHGIGLSVAKAIVSAHNGQISASTCGGRSFQITAEFSA